MAKYINQKAKILFLQQMLYETGENHTVSMQEILDLLLEKGIRAERKSIYDDMEVLRFFGMDIRYKRERPSGYYLAGTSAPKIVLEKPEIVYETAAEPEPKEEVFPPEEDDLEDVPETAEPAEPDDSVWMQPDQLDRKNQMKLVCTEKGRKAVESYFKDSYKFKWKEEGWVATVPQIDTPMFFGWLTAMGTEVHIQKPRKTIQAYRDYLKMLSREYKSER